MKFEGFYGNDIIKKRVTSLIENGRFPHACILEGEDGSGRKTLAKIISAALLCTSESEKPCGNCNSCKKVFDDLHPDIKLVVPMGVAKQITVDVVRDVRHEVFILPNESKYKISIFLCGGQVNEQAQNALLKIIEEPPMHGIFILICNSRHELLPTIQSRCAVFGLTGVEENLAIRAVSEKIQGIDVQEIAQAANVWGGIVGKMLDGFETGKFDEVRTISKEISQAIIATNEFELMLKLAIFEKDKQLLKDVLVILKLIFRDAVVILSGGDVLISGCREQAIALSERLTQKQLMELIDVTESGNEAILRNVNVSLLITTLCYRMREAIGR